MLWPTGINLLSWRLIGKCCGNFCFLPTLESSPKIAKFFQLFLQAEVERRIMSAIINWSTIGMDKVSLNKLYLPNLQSKTCFIQQELRKTWKTCFQRDDGTEYYERIVFSGPQGSCWLLKFWWQHPIQSAPWNNSQSTFSQSVSVYIYVMW